MRARGSFQPQAMAACLHVGDELAEPARARSSAEVADVLRAKVSAGGPWEVELGFGKGRYLVARAAAEPAVRFLGIELVAEFFRLAARRAARRRLQNLVLLQAEALYALNALLPCGFARALHVYFPDPWPKARHQRRRLFDAETVDLLLRALAPAGRLFFASDHLEYAARVIDVLESHPLLEVTRLEDLWPEGPRTNYEAKYVAEGRPICRLVATLAVGDADAGALLHPAGARNVIVAWRQPAPARGAGAVAVG